jgi:hypothetical protein
VYKDTHRTQVRRYNIMKSNIIGRLGEPRLRLVKALLSEKYGERKHTAQEMLSVIHENDLQLYTTTDRLRPEKQIQEAMSIAHKKLKG